MTPLRPSVAALLLVAAPSLARAADPLVGARAALRAGDYQGAEVVTRSYVSSFAGARGRDNVADSRVQDAEFVDRFPGGIVVGLQDASDVGEGSTVLPENDHDRHGEMAQDQGSLPVVLKKR